MREPFELTGAEESVLVALTDGLRVLIEARCPDLAVHAIDVVLGRDRQRHLELVATGDGDDERLSRGRTA